VSRDEVRVNGTRIFVVREGGLVGALFSPASSETRPAVVVLGRSEGGLLGEGVAATLARRGYAALALAYFGTRSLPSELVEIPLEYFAGALRWLRSRPETDGDRVALMGGSKAASWPCSWEQPTPRTSARSWATCRARSSTRASPSTRGITSAA
jgi:hypothetical protein